ncbi:MAG: DNA-binding GntR family transcriptional regulator [Bermanella sp.]|jgi:DNA-binding GntR family transcriptional regulator
MENLLCMDKKSPITLTLLERSNGVTIAQWVYMTLRSAVMNGEILPGRALTIRGLAEIMGVSPMPVREAIRQLAAQNALEITASRRVSVPQMTALKFNELCEARIAIEPHAAARALPYITSSVLDELSQLNKLGDLAIENGNLDKISPLNQAFHRAMYNANPNQVCLPMIESLWLQLGPFMHLATSKLEEFYLVDRHEEAMKAIKAQDPFALQVAIQADIREGIAFASTAERLQTFIEHSNQVR